MTTEPGPAVTIGLREVYDLVLEVKSQVGELKTTEIVADVADHENRIRTIEKWMWKQVGLGAAIGSLGGFILSELVGRIP